MDFTERNLKTWSRIGSRATFGVIALELAQSIDDLIIVTSDVSTSAGLDRFKSKFPEKYLDVGIAEQNLIGIAAGLASEKYKVITTTFAPFQTFRCCEQIKVNLGYMKHQVCMVGLASGVVLGTLGYTHCCIEDIAIMRSIPNITVLSPADCGETAKALLAAVKHDKSVYIRLTGGSKAPMVYTEDYEFVIGQAVTFSRGKDVTVIATGPMVHESIGAIELLRENGVDAGLVNMHTIKPLDEKVIKAASEESRLLVTVEEHSIVGGLGSAVAETLARLNGRSPLLTLGLPDHYEYSGEYRDILEMSGLISKEISNSVLRRLAIGV